MTEPETKTVRAVKVEPYIWGQWCSIEDGEPFVNTVMDVRWSEDGNKIILCLESHNFYFANPNEDLELVPIPPKPHRANYPPFVLPPQPTFEVCRECGTARPSGRKEKP